MKIYHNSPIKASEIRYTRPDGKEGVVYTNDSDYRYIVKEIEDVMGHDFAYGVQEVFETWEGYLTAYHDEMNEVIDDFKGAISDSVDEIIDKLVSLQKYMKQPGAADDRTINEYVDAAIDAVSSINSDIDYLIDEADNVNKDLGF